MKCLIETSLKDFFLSLINKNKTLFYIHKKNLQKKADFLPNAFNKILLEQKINIDDIKEFYITIGPGSFMGARTSFIFARTICQITQAKLFVLDTLTFLAIGKDGQYFLDAKSNKSYRAIISNQKTFLDIVDFQEDSLMDYKNLIKNPQNYLQNFQKVKDLLKIEPKYIKNPQIGGLK